MPKNRKSRRKLSLSKGDEPAQNTVVLIGEGQVLADRYRVNERVGVGGMGMIFRAEDLELDNRVVALKVLPPEMSSSSAAIKRLKKEAIAAIQLHHPHIMAVHAFETDEPHHFLVMEFLDGPDLENALIEADYFEVERMLDVARQVCPALDYAHSKGVIHRDIKPANLLYTKENEEQIVKIADFGIAYQVRNSVARLTGQDLSAGTLHYMPPEQLAGKKVNARADQYALAASLYELASGRPPFDGSGIMLMRQIEEKTAEVIEDVPDHINAAFQKALSKKPEDRFENCADFLAAMEGAPVVVESVSEVKEPVVAEPVVIEEEQEKETNSSSGVASCFWYFLLFLSFWFCLVTFVFNYWIKEPKKKPQPARRVRPIHRMPIHRPTRAQVPTRPPSERPSKPLSDPPLVSPKPKRVVTEVKLTAEPLGATLIRDAYDRRVLGKVDGPITLSLMAIGKFSFLLKAPEGYEDKGFTIEVDGSKKEIEHHVVLKRLFSQIIFDVAPAHAIVKIDGHVVSKDKLKGLRRNAGKYVIEVKAKGYESKKLTVTTKVGEDLPVKLHLDKVKVVKKLIPGLKEYTNSVGMKFVWIPPGVFAMGGRKQVTISRGFWMCRYEVSQPEWQKVMGANPSKYKGASLPVDSVSWNDCQSFVQKLNSWEKTSKYRLPYEAEWEYACRAGTPTAYSFGDEITKEQANFNNLPRNYTMKMIKSLKPTAVGALGGNRWGLYDMHGNVEEWCQDWYTTDYLENATSLDPKGPASGFARVLRGGSWNIKAEGCSPKARRCFSVDKRGYTFGCRIIREE